jgi:hypothetical protein
MASQPIVWRNRVATIPTELQGPDRGKKTGNWKSGGQDGRKKEATGVGVSCVGSAAGTNCPFMFLKWEVFR